MAQVGPEVFRRKLIQRLIDETRWPRQAALSGVHPRFAERLGVTESVFLEAVDAVRAGYRTKPSDRKRSTLVTLRMVTPIEITYLVDNLAVTLDRTRTGLIRDLVHAAMLSTHEPTRQPRAKIKKMVFRDRLLSGKWRYDGPRISQGLKAAVVRRAHAFGEAPSLYVRAWLIDLVEGRLGDLEIPPIRSGQMFDSPEAYVLPARTK
jgi:hypothetical protein